MTGTVINQHPEIWESEDFAEGEGLRPQAKLPNLWVLVNYSPSHEEGPGYFLDSERMGRCSWFRALTYSLSEKLKIKETNGIIY